MPQLLILPNEVLLQVIGDLSHGGLENFALTCKRILDLSWNAIQEKKDAYSTIQCGDVRIDSVGGPCLFTVLHDILLDESIAVYTTEIIIGDGSLVDEGLDPLLGRRIKSRIDQILLEVEDKLFSALRACPYLCDDEAETFHQRIMTGQKDEAVAFLLTLLPNLHSIEARNCFAWDGLFTDRMLQRISTNPIDKAQGQNWDDEADCAQHKTRKKGASIEPDTTAMVTSANVQIHALSKLRDVKMVALLRCSVSPFEVILDSISFPSLQSISGSKILGYYRQLHAIGSFDRTEIKIEDKFTEVGTLQDVLMNIFKYRCHAYSDRITSFQTWERCDINQSLLSILGHPEEDLANAESGCISVEGYLKDHQALTTVHLNNNMFSKDYLERRDHLAASIPWYDVPSSIESLPATVTHLLLTQSLGKGDAREALKILPELKRNGHSGLERVTIHQEPNLCEDLEDALKDVGIELRRADGECLWGGIWTLGR